MVALSLVLTVLGVIALLFSPGLGLLIFIVAALMFTAGNRRKKAAVEERRHREMVEAMKQREQ